MLQKMRQSTSVIAWEERHGNAYAVQMDILAFSGAGGTCNRIGVREHSVRQQLHPVGRGSRVRRLGDRVHGQDHLK